MDSQEKRRMIRNKLYHLSSQERLKKVKQNLSWQIEQMKKDYMSSVKEFIEVITNIKLVCDEVTLSTELCWRVKLIEEKILSTKSMNIVSRAEECKRKIELLYFIPRDVNFISELFDERYESLNDSAKELIQVDKVAKLNEYKECLVKLNDKRSDLMAETCEVKKSFLNSTIKLLELLSREMMREILASDESFLDEGGYSDDDDDDGLDTTVFHQN